LFCITTTHCSLLFQKQKLLQQALLQELQTYDAFIRETPPQLAALFNELYTLIKPAFEDAEEFCKSINARFTSAQEAQMTRNAIRAALKVSAIVLPTEYRTVVLQDLYML
jgi:hypothetical protein